MHLFVLLKDVRRIIVAKADIGLRWSSLATDHCSYGPGPRTVFLVTSSLATCHLCYDSGPRTSDSFLCHSSLTTGQSPLLFCAQFEMPQTPHRRGPRCIYSLPLRMAAMRRGFRRACMTATTHKGFSSRA